MGLLNGAVNGHARMGVSSAPWADKPLDMSGLIERRKKLAEEARTDAALRRADRVLNETAAADTIRRTHRFTRQDLPPLKQEVRDILRSGYAPGSEGDRMFAALHRVNVIGDANGNGDDVFCGSSVAGPSHGRLVPAASLAETDRVLSRKEVLASLAEVHGETKPTQELSESTDGDELELTDDELELDEELTEDIDALLALLHESFDGMNESEVEAALEQMSPETQTVLEVLFGDMNEGEAAELLEPIYEADVDEDLQGDKGEVDVKSSPAHRIASASYARAKKKKINFEPSASGSNCIG